MLSWFTRNTSKTSKQPPPSSSYASEQQQPPAEVAPSAVPTGNPSSQEPTHTTVAPAVTDATPPRVATAPTSEQPRKVFTAALNTPHDTVLAELQGQPPGHDLSARTDATPSTSALGMQSIDTLPVAPSDAPGSTATSTSPLPESLFDPFTGIAVGLLSPIPYGENPSSSSSEDLWAHLTRIRSLQADVARLHLTMEGIGLGDSATPHMRSTAPRAVGERLEDDENIDGEAEKRRTREFERSEKGFDRRKEEIEQIMAKLGEVSQELAAFHAFDAPMFNSTAATSRPTTVSSMPVPLHPTSRHRDLHRVSLEASPRGREEFFESPADIHEPLPIFEEPESAVEHVLPSASTT